MEDTFKIRKDKIKNIAIIFLTVMLILTFFSNSILNYSLPEVATQYVQSGTITEKVRGTGIVTADDPYKIVVSDSRVIESVAVKKGDEVEKDQVLFVLEDKDSDELTKAQTELDALVFAFAQKILSGDISNTAFLNAQNGNIASVTAYQAQIQAANDKVTAARNAQDSAQNSVNSIQKQLDILSNKTVNTVAEEAAVTKATANLENANTNVSTIERSIEALTGGTGSTSTLDILKLNETNALADYKNKASVFNTKDPTAITATVNGDETFSFTIASTPEADLDTNMAEIYKNEDKKTAYTNMQKAYETYRTAANTRATAEKNALSLTDLQAQLDNAKAAAASAQNALDKANQDLFNVKNTSSSTATKESLSNQLVEANAGLTTAKSNLEKATLEQTNLVKDIQSQLDLGNQNSLIADKQEEVAKLQEKATGATITAPVAGIVTELAKTAGESTVPDEMLATIQVAGKGFTVNFSVTNEQAKKVQVGDVADLQNAWYYEDVKATLAKIKPDTEDPGKKKQLVFNVEGTIQDGESLSLSLGKQSANYDYVVPNSAVREDKNGKFILIIEEKSTPFGNRYKAKRVDAEVLAADDNQTAISAQLEGYEYVITTSNKPVEEGKQVRLADN